MVVVLAAAAVIVERVVFGTSVEDTDSSGDDKIVVALPIFREV